MDAKMSKSKKQFRWGLFLAWFFLGCIATTIFGAIARSIAVRIYQEGYLNMQVLALAAGILPVILGFSLPYWMFRLFQGLRIIYGNRERTSK
jgi:hypothetical protein